MAIERAQSDWDELPPALTGAPCGRQPWPGPAAPASPQPLIRSASAADRPALAEMLSRCTDSTRLQRFSGSQRSFPEPYLTEALSGHPEHFALVAGTPASIVALASCRAVAGDTAELAVLVEDAWQRHGIGTRLLNELIEHADRSGLRTLRATVLAEQEWIVQALRSYGTCTAPLSKGVFQVTVRREPHHAGPPGTTSASPRQAQLAPSIAARVRASFASQQMMTLLGAQLIQLDLGRCVLSLDYRAELSQQHGYFHGAAVGAIADVAGGYAAYSMAPADCDVLTVEYKLSLYAPACGTRLEAIGEVLRPGRLTTCLVDVFDIQRDGPRRRCATALQTVTRIARPHPPPARGRP